MWKYLSEVQGFVFRIEKYNVYIRFKGKSIAKIPGPQAPEIRPVLNALSVSLSEVETSLLSKGLNFCPTPQNGDNTRVFFRKQRLKEHFQEGWRLFWHFLPVYKEVWATKTIQA